MWPVESMQALTRRENLLPILQSLVLHGVILGMLSVSLARDPQPLASPADQQREPVQAQVVDSASLQAEIQRQEEAERREEQRKAAEEQARRERLAELERQEQAEQERLERLARQRRQEEEQARRQQQAEEQRLQQLQAEKEAAERRRQEEQERLERLAEQQRQEQQRLAELKEEQEAAEAAKRQAEAEAQLQRQIAEEQKRLEEEARREAEAAKQRQQELVPLRAEYVRAIRGKIERNWIQPPSLRPGLRCELRISQIPGGEVVDLRFGSCNGDEAVRRSIEVAVFKASPLPGPPAEAPELFEREIILDFTHEAE